MLACAAMGPAFLLRATLALVLTVPARAVTGCMAVPDLRFAEEDAAGDDGATHSADAGVLDAGDAGDAEPPAEDAAEAERGAKAHKACPDAAASDNDPCCGRVRCVGSGCAPSQCDMCKRCAAVCCIPEVGAAASCVPNVAACK